MRWPAIVVLAFAVAAIAWVLGEQDEAAWVRLRGPTVLSPGEAAVVTLTLSDPETAGFLMCDIHGGGRADSSLRVVAHGVPQAVVSGQDTYSFAPVLPDIPGIDHAHFVVYRSTSPRWKDRWIAATSRRYPVESPAAAASQVAAVPVFNQVHDPGMSIPDHRVARWLTGLTWIACAGIVVVARASGALRGWVGLAWISLFAALAAWELAAGGARLAELARTLAQDSDLYENRRGWQQFITAGALALAATLVAMAVVRPRVMMPFAVIAGVTLYGIVSVGAMLSLHEVDRVLGSTVLGISWAALLRFAAAAAAALGLLRAARRTTPLPHPGR